MEPTNTTVLGTPCSPAWDEGWVAVVNETEGRLGRRVCGARTVAGTPCALASTHSSGRCRFHGGFDLTGAQPGNRNAVVHGLYTRALQPCGKHCPLWNSCPCAGPDLEELPANERPTCPYEATLYQTLITDGVAGSAHDPVQAPYSQHLVHQLALVQVLTLRAALALRARELVRTTETGNGESRRSEESPYLQVYLRLSGECRHYLKLVELNRPVEPSTDKAREHERQSQHDASLAPEHQAELYRTASIPDAQAFNLMRRALQERHRNRPYVAHTFARDAAHLSPTVVAFLRTHWHGAGNRETALANGVPEEKYDAAFDKDRFLDAPPVFLDDYLNARGSLSPPGPV